ncbi:MAG: glycosyltransferase family 4 protein [Calditrichia bacterium]
MNIVLFCRYFSADFEYMENAFARQFQSLGHRVTIVTTTRVIPRNYQQILSADDEHGDRPAGTLEENGFTVVRLEGHCWGRNGGIELLPGLSAALKNLKPDLLFFQSVENFPIALQTALLKYRLGYRYYVVVNEHYIYARGAGASGIAGIKAAFLDAVAKVCKKVSLAAATRIIGMNEYSSEVAKKLYFGAAEKMTEITLGVDSETIFHKPESRRKIRKEYGVLPDEILIVHSGKMAPYKKTHLILEAIGRLGRRDLKLLLIGKCEPAYQSTLTDLIKAHSLEKQVNFVPWVAPVELHHYFSASDIAIWVDHATISTIEASAVGIPIIVPDFHGYEHRTKYCNGLRIQPGDLDDLTLKLGQLLENMEEASAMGKRGRELVEKELNWSSIVQKILN